MLNELGVGGKHFTKTKIRFLFWDENLGATFTTQSWILLAQMPRMVVHGFQSHEVLTNEVTLGK